MEKLYWLKVKFSNGDILTSEKPMTLEESVQVGLTLPEGVEVALVEV